MLDDIRNMKDSFLLKEIYRKLLNIFETSELLERETNEHRKRMMAKMDRSKYNCLYLLARPKGDNFSQGQCAFDNARRRKRFIDYGIRGLEWPTRSPDPNFARKSMGHYRAESLHGKELAEALKQKGIDARNYKLFGTRNRIVEIN